jgi:hypothetical protein
MVFRLLCHNLGAVLGHSIARSVQLYSSGCETRENPGGKSASRYSWERIPITPPSQQASNTRQGRTRRNRRSAARARVPLGKGTVLGPNRSSLGAAPSGQGSQHISTSASRYTAIAGFCATTSKRRSVYRRHRVDRRLYGSCPERARARLPKAPANVGQAGPPNRWRVINRLSFPWAADCRPAQGREAHISGAIARRRGRGHVQLGHPTLSWIVSG